MEREKEKREEERWWKLSNWKWKLKESVQS